MAVFEKRFSNVDANSEMHEKRTAIMEIRLDAFEVKLEAGQASEAKLGVQFDELESRFSLLYEGYCGNDERLRKLWDKNVSLEERMEEVFGAVDFKFETVFERLLALESTPKEGLI